MAKTKLKPCPFCESNEVKPWRMLGSPRFYMIMCTECGALGPMFEEYDSSKKGTEGSIALWNKRGSIFKLDSAQ